MNAPKLAAHLDGDFSRVFFLLLGLLSQIYGGGISGNMMHEYEGWQVCAPSQRRPKKGPAHLSCTRIEQAWADSFACRDSDLLTGLLSARHQDCCASCERRKLTTAMQRLTFPNGALAGGALPQPARAAGRANAD